jgi:hypothetical protein
MATTREFTRDELDCEAFDDAVEIASAPWRHGRKVRLVWEVDGAHWAAWFHHHHDEGDQSFYPITATKVHQVERTVKAWEDEP